jgi:hypothetical protein
LHWLRPRWTHSEGLPFKPSNLLTARSTIPASTERQQHRPTQQSSPAQHGGLRLTSSSTKASRPDGQQTESDGPHEPEAKVGVTNSLKKLGKGVINPIQHNYSLTKAQYPGVIKEHKSPSFVEGKTRGLQVPTMEEMVRRIRSHATSPE